MGRKALQKFMSIFVHHKAGSPRGLVGLACFYVRAVNTGQWHGLDSGWIGDCSYFGKIRWEYVPHQTLSPPHTYLFIVCPTTENRSLILGCICDSSKYMDIFYSTKSRDCLKAACLVLQWFVTVLFPLDWRSVIEAQQDITSCVERCFSHSSRGKQLLHRCAADPKPSLFYPMCLIQAQKRLMSHQCFQCT